MQSDLPAATSRSTQQAVGRFVINLMSSTTPMALAQPNHGSLKQYTFFITRRRQDHRERFRLHMGYFHSQRQAEEMLVKVREIFPSAWAGMAPGNTEQKLAAQYRAVTAASYDLAHVPIQAPAPAPVALPAPPPRSAITAAAVAGKAAADKAAVSRPDAAMVVPTKLAAATPQPARAGAAQSLQSVRAAINALGDGSGKPSVLEDTSATAQLKALSETRSVPALDESAVLKVLEESAAAPRAREHSVVPKAAAADASGAVKETPALTPGGFAVQLQWSAMPIDIAQLPYLAIFEAYTLYIAEGKREGRRWYGLRLGFFSDGASAKQVAQYLRSEFSSVAVVPISARERERARRASKTVVPAAISGSAKPQGVKLRAEDYQLLDVEVATGTVPKEVAAEALNPELSKELTDLATSPVKTTARKVATPLTLEETLEILGANDVGFQEKQSEMLSSSAVRSLRHAADSRAPEKRSALGKLFDRLGESLGR
jgi:hypothetical protein